MMIWCPESQLDSMMPPGINPRSSVMKWETPAAVDFRFGMEITMYISNR
jgi:coenzyme PQQ precursor peptide PqqA